MHTKALGSVVSMFACWFAGLILGALLNTVNMQERVPLVVTCLVVGIASANVSVQVQPPPVGTSRWIECTLGFIMFFGLGFVFISPLGYEGKASAKNGMCRSNAKQFATVAILYSADFDDRLPLAESWHMVSGYGRAHRIPVKCPEAIAPYSYAMNQALSGASLAGLPDHTILIFEVESPTPYPYGGPKRFRKRHREIGNVADTNGQSRSIADTPEENNHWTLPAK